MSASRTSWLRLGVAVAAAYALVLQIVLTGILATRMTATSDAAAACYGGDAHPPDTAAHQACAICSVAPSVSLPSATAPIALRLAVAPDFQRPAERSALVRRLHSPRSSQGPPQTA